MATAIEAVADDGATLESLIEPTGRHDEKYLLADSPDYYVKATAIDLAKRYQMMERAN